MKMNKERPSVRPAHSQSIYWLKYPDARSFNSNKSNVYKVRGEFKMQ